MIKLIIIFLILYLIFVGSKNMILSKTAPRENPVFRGNPYDILGITPEFSDEQIKEAYRENSRKNHPDLVGHMSSDFQKLAEEKLKQINWAYNEIKKIRGL